MREPISPERWKQIEPLLDAAIELEANQRQAFVDNASRGDPELQANLTRLLATYDPRDSLFDRPAAERFALLVDDRLARLPEVLDGRYHIEREIGRGGMATVYLARDLRHERNVAVKVLHAETAAALGAERFLAEIKMTAQLQHPHILPLHDSGNADGFLFYVMPFVEGGSLRRRLGRGERLPIDHALRIAREIASALDAAHRQGVVHRDIKPENILLHDGTALVADFGIAIAMSDGFGRTESGATLGTPQYMSPEQATRDAPIDSRSDVYALGTVVYEMLAGQPPYSRSTALDVLAKRSEMPPPLDVLRSAAPGVVDVMTRVLARDPNDRFRTAGDFADALEQSLSPNAISKQEIPPEFVTPVLRRLGVRNLTLAGLAGFAAVMLVASRLWLGGTRPALDANKVVVLPFAITGGDSSLNYLSEGVVELFAPMLTGEGGPVAVYSRTALSAWRRVSRGREGTADVARAVARGVGAGKAMLGTGVVVSGRLTLAASIVDAERGDTRALAPVSGSLDSLQTLLDGLLRQVLVRHAGVPERTVGELMSQSLPALRAYLDGRAAYRRAHRAEAIQFFTRAIDLDSTFALAAMDLATASGRLLRQMACRNYICGIGSGNAAVRDAGTASDDQSFDRGVELAWQFKSKLSSRDQKYLAALHGPSFPEASSARETFVALQQAALAAPDRAETQYLLGILMLYQGSVLRYSDSFARAQSLFDNALRLDSAYLAPLAGLIDIAAYESDQTRLRLLGARYLERDSLGATADFIRWRLAVGTNDGALLRTIHARFDSLDVPTLKQIVTTSQMSGIALDDADRATALIITRVTDPNERAQALGSAHILALNRGRPRHAMDLMRLRHEFDTAPFDFWASTTTDAVFSGVSDAEVAPSIRERELWLARDTLLPTAGAANVPGQTRPQQASRGSAFYQALWDWSHGQRMSAQSLATWLRRRGATLQADATEMLIATDEHRDDAAVLRARVDSAARQGCCAGPTQIDLMLAIAYERAGRDSAALDVIRRGRWRYPTFLLSTYLVTEGRVAARAGDTTGAIRAYEHYLALRSHPEPELRADRDSIQAIVNRMKRGR